MATSEGKLYANELLSSGEVAPMKIPALFTIQHDKVALAKSFRVSYEFIRDMRKVSNLHYSHEVIDQKYARWLRETQVT